MIKKKMLFLSLTLAFTASAWAYSTRLINGDVVNKEEFPHVVRIKTNGASCTATVVGPRVIITAAHCARTNATSVFTTAGKTYYAKIERSRLYPRRDHDIAVGITSKDITDVRFVNVGGEATKGMTLDIFGYGCTRPGGSGGNDGYLRRGDAVVTGFSSYDMVSKKGAALCYGDSGGPAFATLEDGSKALLGVNSKGNIRDTNYNTRTDIDLSRQFLDRIVNENDVEICGINTNC